MIRGYKKLKVKKQKGPGGPGGPGGTRGRRNKGQEGKEAREPGKWEAQRPRGPGSHQVEFRPSPLSSQ